MALAAAGAPTANAIDDALATLRVVCDRIAVGRARELKFERSYRACYFLCVYGMHDEALRMGRDALREMARLAVRRTTYDARMRQLLDVFMFSRRRVPGGLATACAYDLMRVPRRWAWVRLYARCAGAWIVLLRRAAERRYRPGAIGAHEAKVSFEASRKRARCGV